MGRGSGVFVFEKEEGGVFILGKMGIPIVKINNF